ncbi:hypothetical protein Daesc_009539 [Daldinia eschscholtzii]|uniref:Fungal specific transcription factor n=1 Tax=Daldinia eschscholtzii TaxID=292717 RepID=A0AAX6M9Z3_9PEZI
MSTADLHAQLDALYDTWTSLTPTSPPSDFEKFAAFFDENCYAWLFSMRELAEPSIGRQGVIDGVKEVLKLQRIEERRVVERFASARGSKISVEMKNRYNVVGEDLDTFWETVTAEFNDKGLITDFKVHCCRSPMVAIIQKVTGEGPYKCHEL